MIMCKSTTNEQGICFEIPMDHIRKHKEDLEVTDEKVAEVVADLVYNAAVKATKMILENNWHEFTVDDEPSE